MEKISMPLYNGSVVLDFYPGNHWYKIGKEFIPSVTGICGIVDKSEPLMRWAVNCFRDCLYEHMKTSAVDKAAIENARLEFTRVKQEAANVGTMVHDYCEQYANGGKPEMPENEQARNGIKAFIDRVTSHNVQFLETERLVYSKAYNYCGKLDTVAICDGVKCLFDFKTSKKHKIMEYGMQTAAYKAAWEEENNDTIQRRAVLRFDKETGEFEVHWLDDDHTSDFVAFRAAAVLRKKKKETDKLEKAMI